MAKCRHWYAAATHDNGDVQFFDLDMLNDPNICGRKTMVRFSHCPKCGERVSATFPGPDGIRRSFSFEPSVPDKKKTETMANIELELHTSIRDIISEFEGRTGMWITKIDYHKSSIREKLKVDLNLTLGTL